jgi:glycosyltransferase involved in cell wall biosynthesis
MIAAHGITVVHQPIPVSPRESSLLHGLGVPVIIGPMNGGMTYPPGFTRAQGGATTAFMKIGRALSTLLNRLMPGKLRAELLLVANERTRLALPRGTLGRVTTLVENGVDLSLWTPRQRKSDPSLTRFAFTGRLVDWKAVDILLDAFKLVLAQVPATLDILGSGKMRPALESQARNLNLDSHVKFHGWVAQPQCVQTLGNVDVLVLPSLYECGGAVVLEAMAMGLPVIATDWGGPADYLDATSGILVPPRSREQFVTDLAAAMVKLARSPDLRQKMGQAGRRRVEESFDWERKVDRMMEIYRGGSGSLSPVLRGEG